MVPWRREAGLRKARKALRVIRERYETYGSHVIYDDDSKTAKIMLRTRQSRSGTPEGNPRRLWGDRTRQELIADIEMQEQLDELGVDHIAVEWEELFDTGYFDYWPECDAWEVGSAWECMLASEVVLSDWLEPWPEFDGGGNEDQS